MAASTVPYRSSASMDWLRNTGGSPVRSDAFSLAAASMSGLSSTAISSYPRSVRRAVMLPVPQARSSTVCTGMRLFRKSFSM